MSKFIQVGAEYVLNVEHVTNIYKTVDHKLFIYLVGQTDPERFEGREANALWAYFTAATPNICPAAAETENAETLTTKGIGAQTNNASGLDK